MEQLGRCLTCQTPYAECEISAEDPDYATDANGNHEGLCCEDCQHHAAVTGITITVHPAPEEPPPHLRQRRLPPHHEPWLRA